MASVWQRNGVWRVEVAVNRERVSKSFDSEQAARKWAASTETRMKRRVELKDLAMLGQAVPGFPSRILNAMIDAPLSPEEIVANAIPTSIVCGIYFLIRGTRIIYVGQSRNVLRRIARHIDDGKQFDRFTIAPCKPEDLDQMERTYITALYPDENMTLGVSNRLRRLGGQESVNLLDGDQATAVHA